MMNNWKCFWWALIHDDIRDCLIYVTPPYEQIWIWHPQTHMKIPSLKFGWPCLKIVIPGYLLLNWQIQTGQIKLEDISLKGGTSA